MKCKANIPDIRKVMEVVASSATWVTGFLLVGAVK